MINWKSRLRNKAFLVALASALVMLIQQLGFNFIPENWQDVFNAVLTVLMSLGIVIDPSTQGISDKGELN